MPQALGIGVIAFVNLFFGFLGQWLVLFSIGVGRETDALYATIGLPQMLFVIATSPLVNVLTPRLAALSAEEADQHASAAASAIAIILAPLFLLLIIFASTWTRVLLPGFQPSYRPLVTTLAQIHLLGIYLSCTYGVVWASVSSKHRFVAGELALAATTIAYTLAIYPVAKTFGIVGVAWLFTARASFRLFVLLPLGGVRPTLKWKGADLKKLFVTIRFPTMAVAYHSSEQVFDRYLISYGPPGLLSLFSMALSLVNAAVGILNRAAFAPVLPKLGELSGRGRFSELRSMVIRYARLAATLGGAGIVVLAFFGEYILLMLVGRGGITANNVRSLWHLTLALGGILAGNATTIVFSHGLFALNRAKEASIAFSIAFTMGLAMKALGFSLLGVVGLALGSSAYYLLATVLYGRKFFMEIDSINLSHNKV